MSKGNLRNDSRTFPKPPRVQDIHRLGQLAGMWCCQNCQSIYTHARTRRDAESSHESHLRCVQYHREHPDDPERYA